MKRVPKLKGLSELEGARIAGCQNWRKVPVLEQGQNLSIPLLRL